eukprot:gene5722-10975_t
MDERVLEILSDQNDGANTFKKWRNLRQFQWKYQSFLPTLRTLANENALTAAVGGVDYIGPYMDKPLADDEWIENYNWERREEKQQIEELNRRLNGTEPLPSALYEKDNPDWAPNKNLGLEKFKAPSPEKYLRQQLPKKRKIDETLQNQESEANDSQDSDSVIVIHQRL